MLLGMNRMIPRPVRPTSTSIVSIYVHEMAAKNPLVGLSGVPWGLRKMQSRHPYLVHMVVITAFVQNHLFPIENHIKQPKIDEFCILCQFESS